MRKWNLSIQQENKSIPFYQFFLEFYSIYQFFRANFSVKFSARPLLLQQRYLITLANNAC
jgi:hypothetical protein